MKIIVCIKQVPDPESEIVFDEKKGILLRDKMPAVINPLDLYAIEEALLLKEKYGGETVAISMGPPQTEDALREALSMGIDDAILLCDKRFAGADTLATSYTLSKAIEKIGEYDLIICGKNSVDADTGQVGPQIAEFLKIPHIAYVAKIVEIEENNIIVKRMTEEGYEIVKSELPCLITVIKGINTPRIPSLRGKLQAKKKEIKIWKKEDIKAKDEKIGLKGSPTKVKRVYKFEIKKEVKIIKEEPDKSAKIIYDFLKEGKFLR